MRKIPVASPCLNGNERKYVDQCIDTAWISSNGEFIQRFEKSFAAFVGSKHAISCCNGTVALHLPLLAYGVGPGDEVIVPTLTYIATANAVTYCGAKPVLAESEPQTGNLDPAQLERLITPRTKGIIVVHLYGHPADMDPILELARKHKLFVIEDAAEAHGAEYKGRRVGAIGHLSTFSFFGNKIITTGEGGMICTDDDTLAAKIRLLKGQGMDPSRRYWFPVVGYNYRMTNVEAALGLAQLEKIDWHLERRQEVARSYYRHLSGLERWIEVPTVRHWGKHSFWMFSIVLKPELPVSRDDFMARLAAAGIETRPYFYPMHVMPPYFQDGKPFPVATSLAERGINLPTHALLTEDDIAYVAAEIRKLCRAG